jgi:hypothetical protein
VDSWRILHRDLYYTGNCYHTPNGNFEHYDGRGLKLARLFFFQSVMNEIRQNLGELPMVEDELRKASGDEQTKDESLTTLPAGTGRANKFI